MQKFNFTTSELPEETPKRRSRRPLSWFVVEAVNHATITGNDRVKVVAPIGSYETVAANIRRELRSNGFARWTAVAGTTAVWVVRAPVTHNKTA